MFAKKLIFQFYDVLFKALEFKFNFPKESAIFKQVKNRYMINGTISRESSTASFLGDHCLRLKNNNHPWWKIKNTLLIHGSTLVGLISRRYQ